MLTKDLQCTMFWAGFQNKEGEFFKNDSVINQWLKENPDREIERIDYSSYDKYPLMIIWHRKIDPDFRSLRGPEA